jgi:hypothetical protein
MRTDLVDTHRDGVDAGEGQSPGRMRRRAFEQDAVVVGLVMACDRFDEDLERGVWRNGRGVEGDTDLEAPLVDLYRKPSRGLVEAGEDVVRSP